MTITDPRTWVEQGTTIYIRVPQADYRHGRTIAWARPDPADPGAWEVRVLAGPNTGRWSVATRIRARHLLDAHTAHLLDATVDRPTRRTRWTGEQEQRLLVMAAARVSHAQIAAALGRTVSAVDERLKILRRAERTA